MIVRRYPTMPIAAIAVAGAAALGAGAAATAAGASARAGAAAVATGRAPAAAARRAVHKRARAAQTPPALADARLEGTFALTGTVMLAAGVAGERAGQQVARDWTFIPQCTMGRCGDELLVRQRPPSSDLVSLEETRPAYYTGRGQFYMPLRCGTSIYPTGEQVPFVLTVRITGAALVGSVEEATTVVARYSSTTRINATPCVLPPRREVAVYAGGLAPSPTAGAGTS